MLKLVYFEISAHKISKNGARNFGDKAELKCSIIYESLRTISLSVTVSTKLMLSAHNIYSHIVSYFFFSVCNIYLFS